MAATRKDNARTLFVGLLTQLADIWFVFVLSGIVYVWGPNEWFTTTAHETGLRLAGLSLGAIILTYALKYTFTVPRPPGATTATPPVWIPTTLGPVYESLVTGQGYRFPSGHALMATVVYGSLATVVTLGTHPLRIGAAAGVIVLIATTRVVLGVHHPRDVVAGVLVGSVYLAIAF